jgi:hypothetical protein
MSEQSKQIVFKVVPNGPSNMTNHIPLCYFHATRKKYLYLDRYHQVQAVDEVDANANIAMLTIDSVNNGFNLTFAKTDADAKKNEQTMNFFKEWPIVARSLPHNEVDSYPSDHHKKHFANIYKADSKEALPVSVQPLKYIDEVEQTTLNAKEKRSKMQISTSLNTVAKEEKKMVSICFLLGIDPYGLGEDEIFNVLYDAVMDGDKGDRFLEIIQDAKWDNRLVLAVETAKVLGLITVDDNGLYQFLGEPISRDSKALPYYFKTNNAHLINLKHELIGKGMDFSDLEFDEEKGEVISTQEKKSTKGGGSTKRQPSSEPEPVGLSEQA